MSSTRAMRAAYRWGVLLLLMLFFGLSLSSARRKSPTVDEGGKLAMGYGFLRTFDLRFQALHKHPRLAEAWAALPLLADPRVPAPADVPGWDEPQDYFDYVVNFYYHNPDVARYTFVGRVQTVLLGLVAGALVFRWAAEQFGRPAGLLACFLYTLSPNILANAQLVTNDMAAALMCLAVMYVLQRLLRRPSLARTALFGALLGAALLTKYSTALLLPAAGLLVLCGIGVRSQPWTLWPHLGRWRVLLRVAAAGAAVLAVVFIVVWAGFAFEVRQPQTIALPIRVPAASLIDDFVRLRQFDVSRPAFLLSQWWLGGRWYYYLATFLFKTPVPALVLFLAAVVVMIHRRRTVEQMPLWLFPVVYIAFSMAGGRNTGHRYMLPALPCLCILVSQVAAYIYRRVRLSWLRAGFVVAIGGYALVSLVTWPNYLAYFNLLAGGPSRGYRVLLDSNLDWGQDLIQLQRYMEREKLDEVWLSQFCLTDPTLYGIRYRKLPDWEDPSIPSDFHYLNPGPGVYVVGATFLQGLYLPNISTFDWFQRQEAVDQIGYSMLVYRVEPDPAPPGWLAVCYAPDSPLSPDEIAAAFGRSDLRLVYFDCRSSWVVPGRTSPGWYLVPALAEEQQGLADEGLATARLEFEQRDYDDERVFAVYRVQPSSDLDYSQSQAVWTVAAGTQPDQAMATGAPQRLPLDAEAPAALVGYQISEDAWQPGQTVAVDTIWRANAPVTSTVPSIFLHLIDDAGAVWSVGDALDCPAVQWAAGDIIIQRHSLELAAEMPEGEYWLATGLYDAVSGMRYPVDTSATGADTIWFGPQGISREP
ncbi:MAG: glycosyltransferase family 39 protein [Anaerolineales bacterium]|nr:glycosyltransferase family 39 protein [Anaerolineales bacterium]